MQPTERRDASLRYGSQCNMNQEWCPHRLKRGDYKSGRRSGPQVGVKAGLVSMATTIIRRSLYSRKQLCLVTGHISALPQPATGYSRGSAGNFSQEFKKDRRNREAKVYRHGIQLDSTFAACSRHLHSQQPASDGCSGAVDQTTVPMWFRNGSEQLLRFTFLFHSFSLIDRTPTT